MILSWSTESGTLNDLWKDEKLNSFNLILSFSIVFEFSDEITNTLSFNSIVKSSFFIPGTARSISKESLFSREFTLAKTLHKTVSEICREMTKEEMIGWAAYAELEHEDFEKQQQEAQRSSALKGKRGRMR